MESKTAIISHPEFRFPYYLWKYILEFAKKKYSNVLRLYPSIMSKVDYTDAPRFFVRAWWCGDAGLKKVNYKASRREGVLNRPQATNIFSPDKTSSWRCFDIIRTQKITKKYYLISVYQINFINNIFKIIRTFEGRKNLKDNKPTCCHKIPISSGFENDTVYNAANWYSWYSWRLWESIDIRSLKNFKSEFVDNFDLQDASTSSLAQEICSFYNDTNTPFGFMRPQYI